MDAARVDAILAKIDNAIGKPDDETEAEHEARRLMISRDHDARAIRKASSEDAC